MHFTQRFTILLPITATFILIADRIKTEETEEPIFGCKGKLLNENIGSRNFQKIQHDLKNIKLPESFYPLGKWAYCRSLRHIKDQGRCGGCWAFAATSVMSDRLCIATKGKFNRFLSEQDLMECCNDCWKHIKEGIGGCKGGKSIEAFKYWEEHGLVTGYQGCKPTEEGIQKGIPQKECRQRCTNESYKVDYEKDLTFSVQTFMTNSDHEDDIKHIMAELMLNGPVYGVLNTYAYMTKVPPKSILKFNQSLVGDEEPTSHAIKIIGWDNIESTPVWVIVNSWGQDWCDNGYCFIRRGQNDFKLEVRFYAGIPKLHVTKKKQKKIEKTETSNSNIINITNPIELAVILCILTM